MEFDLNKIEETPHLLDILLEPRPYVYRGTHRETGQFYIGFRGANSMPAQSDLGIKYFTSSKYVKKLGFENFEWEILAEFTSPTAIDDAYWFEQLLIKEAITDSLCLNKHFQDPDTGKRKFNLGGHTHSSEYRLACSKRMLGKEKSQEQKDHMSLVMTGKPKTQNQLDMLKRGRDIARTISRTPEHLQVLSEGLAAFYSDEKFKQKRLERAKKISCSKKGKPAPPRSAETIAKAANTMRKPVSCDGTIFQSRVDAAKHYGVRPETISSRANNPKFPSFFWVKS